MFYLIKKMLKLNIIIIKNVESDNTWHLTERRLTEMGGRAHLKVKHA